MSAPHSSADFFYTPPGSVSGNCLRIEGDELEHLSRVLRHQVNDRVIVTDGVGTAYEVTIDGISRTSADCRILSTHALQNEHPSDITLGVAILKNAARFDYLVEKCTELGVRTIVPLKTAHTIPRSTKIDRWKKLALAAMKQSQRCIWPDVQELTTLDAFFSLTESSELKLIPHEKATKGFRSASKEFDCKRVSVCIGPEGGFTGEELKEAVRNGFSPVTLGPRRLRTETAAIASLAALVEASY